MASDIATTIEDDSRRKHSRSPDEELEESTKRRKHRHHHRSRHHRHHYKSKKHEENKNEEEEVQRGEGDVADPTVLAPSTSHRVSTVLEADLKPDYDMEEGEIVDDADGQIEPADQNLGVDAKGVSSYIESKQEVGHITNQPLEINGRESGGISKIIEDQTSNVEFQSNSVPEKKEGMKFRIGKSKDGSSPKSSIREPYKIHANGYFSWESSKKCNTLTHSVEDGSGNEKVDSRRRSLSYDSVDNRSRSKSIDRQVSLREHSHAIMDADREERRITEFQSGGIGVGKDDTSSNRHTARSPTRNKEVDGDRGSEKERDKSMDKDRRRDRDGEKNRVGERDLQRRARGGDKEKREADRDRGSEKEPDKGMDTERRKDRDRETGRDREKEIQRRSRVGDGGRRVADWDQGNDKEQERRKDRDRETSRDKEKELPRRTRGGDGERWDRGWEEQLDRGMDMDTIRDRNRGTSRDMKRDMESKNRETEQGNGRDGVKERDRSKERHISREHIREKERGRSMENEIDFDRRKVKERDRRNRDMGIDSDIQRESRRDRSRDRVRERDHERERGRDKERDRDRDFSRMRENDSECDKDRGKGREDRDSYSNYRYGETEDYRDRTRRNNPEKLHNSKIDSVKEAEEKWRRDEDEQEDYQERISLQLADQEEEDIEKIKEESRRIRQAILEKYKSNQIQQQITPPSSSTSKDKPIVEKNDQLTSDDTADPEKFDAGNSGDDAYVGDSSFSVGKSPQNELSIPERSSGAGGLGEGTPKSEMSNDMFCDDIFGDSPAGVRKMPKGDGLHSEKSGIHDNWDDAEGYYSYRFGEILDGRYEITAAHGKGVFSNVVRAKDFKDGNSEPEEVAIKIIRNNETMYKSGQSELIILKKLAGADPEDKRHCVRFLSSFKYRNHLCLVFESLHMNLREVLKKFGRNIGLKLTAVRAYAKQLFISLKHLRNCGVLHCDIKPDNMLVNDAKNVLKLCDFGSAMFAGKNEITPYLVSRFYRAPEIILGLPYDHPLDMWSVGCCLYELYTGKVLFPGSTNSDMLRLHMELKGPFPKKMLRKGGFLEQHFDQDLNFLATEENPVTKKTIRRMMNNIKAKDIGTIITSSLGEDPKMVVNFKDLLDKIFVLDPDKRLTVSQALSHPFITGK